MGRRCVLVAEVAVRAELEGLGRSGRRGEADRARAVLWSLASETSPSIATRLGVRAEQVRRWRSLFRQGRGYHPARPSSAGSDAAQAGGGAGGGAGGAERTRDGRPAALDPGAAGAGGHGAHRRDDLLRPPEHGAAKGGYRWRRPRHSLKACQDAGAVDRAGLRLGLLKQQARAGDIHLLFGDESEALTHPYLAHCWAGRGIDLRIEAPGQAKKRALLGALDHSSGELIVITSATKRSADFIDLLGRLDRDYAPRPGLRRRPVGLVLDNGAIHTGRATAKALAARPWLTIEWLPRYTPELNDIERSWRDLKRHYLAQQTFRNVDHLDNAIHAAVQDLNHERRMPTCALISEAA